MTAAANPRAGGVDPLEPAGSTEAATYQRPRAHLATLGLTAAGETLTEVLDAARTEDLTLIAALERLLATEVAAAAARRHAGLLRIAALPAPSTLDDFDFTAQPGVEEKLIGELACLRFLDDAGTILLVSQPGTGKTMLAIGLARAAIDAGHRVYFTTAADLAKRCRRAAADIVAEIVPDVVPGTVVPTPSRDAVATPGSSTAAHTAANRWRSSASSSLPTPPPFTFRSRP